MELDNKLLRTRKTGYKRLIKLPKKKKLKEPDNCLFNNDADNRKRNRKL